MRSCHQKKDEMTSSIRDMSCGTPRHSRDGEGPWVCARQHSSVSQHCLHGSLQPPGSCHVPPAPVRHWEEVTGHWCILHLAGLVGRWLPRAAQGISLGSTGAGMQVSRNTNLLRNTLLASNRLQGLGFILICLHNVPLRCLNHLDSPQSQ